MKLGFIGCGNMGGAMIQGILKAQKCGPQELMASAAHKETLAAREKELGIRMTQDNREVAAFADVLFLAVKPQYYPKVIGQIRDAVRPETCIVSMAAGKTLAWLGEAFGGGRRIVRIMPNTPAMVGEAMTGVCPNELVRPGELELVCDLCGSFGRAEVVAEGLLDAVTAVSGSSPAYVFLFLEAMADAAVLEGMPRGQAYRFAAQAVLGSARMVLETGKHPGELKDMVCSPGGTTIEAVRVLEQRGLRGAVIEAVQACAQKSKRL